jgi:hypothetical protein
MAKVTAPFMSLDASGTIASTLTASKWKGRNYMRLRIIPSNPSTSFQIAVRLILGGVAKAARAVLTSFADVEGEGSQFFQDARDGAPSGQSWISWMQKYSSDIVTKALAHWDELDATEKGYFTTEAGVIGLSDYTPTLGGEARTGLLAGQQLMALGFFGKDYIENATAAAAVDDNSPSEGEVQALGAYVNDTTAS